MNILLIDLFAGWGVSFLLVLTRLSAMIFSFPFFGSSAIPNRLRVSISLVLSFLILPIVGIDGLGIDWSLGQLVWAVFREMAVGLVVGFGSKFMFEAFTLAGTFAGRQMGFALADLVDPITSAPQSMVGQFWTLVAILLFVAADGHHFLVRLLVENYKIVPLIEGSLKPATGQLLITGSANMYQLALRLAAPALILTMMMDVGIGVLTRAMPRLPIFFVAMPAKLFVGIFSLIVSLQLFQAMFADMNDNLQQFLTTLLSSMR